MSASVNVMAVLMIYVVRRQPARHVGVEYGIPFLYATNWMQQSTSQGRTISEAVVPKAASRVVASLKRNGYQKGLPSGGQAPNPCHIVPTGASLYERMSNSWKNGLVFVSPEVCRTIYRGASRATSRDGGHIHQALAGLATMTTQVLGRVRAGKPWLRS